MDTIQATVKAFILEQFLPDTEPSELTPATPLISGGILDSLATIRLVDYLEENFGITVDPQEAGAEYLDTLDQIAALVERKKA